MSILDFDETEFEDALEEAKNNLKESNQSIDECINTSFQSLLFLGKNVKDKPELLEVAIFNIRLCYTYYKNVEDYRKVASIVTLVNDIETGANKIVDANVIDEISINLN